jgi:hypothetical protein
LAAAAAAAAVKKLATARGQVAVAMEQHLRLGRLLRAQQILVVAAVAAAQTTNLVLLVGRALL